MRVLILHNRYRASGGEERAVSETAALLRRQGHTVEVLERFSAEVGRARAARAMLGGGERSGEISDAVARFRADVVHAHNLHPLLGWRALAAAQAAGARTVLHLHNFRLFCAIGVVFHDGVPCHRCHGRNTVPGVVHRCRGSLTEAAVYAAGLSRQNPRLLGHADAIVVLSETHGDRLREMGLPGGKVNVLPNFIGEFAPASRADAGEYALVAGRLVEEKGFDTAVLAARAAAVPLVVAGSGPDEDRLRGLAAGADVRFAGWLEPDALARVREKAAMLLAPSRWEEPCPYAVLEAMATGIPLLVSDRGGLPEMAGRESTLPAENVEAWTARLGALWADPSRRRSSGEAALSAGRERFGPDRAYAGLMTIYNG